MKYLLIATLAALVFSCNTPTAPQTENSSPEPVEVNLTCHDLGEADMMPRNEVLLTINGTPYVIDTIQACDPVPASGYSQYEIPSDATAACGGWWAGAGDYFYAMTKEGSVDVYQGWQDEGQTDEGYHWKLLKSFPLP